MLFVHCIKRYSKFGVLKLILKNVQTLREGKWATEVEVKAEVHVVLKDGYQE